jgi:hypothetical protein
VQIDAVHNLDIAGQDPSGDSGDRIVLESSFDPLAPAAGEVRIQPGPAPDSGQVFLGDERLSYNGIERISARSLLDVFLDLRNAETLLAAIQAHGRPPEYDALVAFTSARPLRPIPPVELIQTRQLSVATAAGSRHAFSVNGAGLGANIQEVALSGGSFRDPIRRRARRSARLSFDFSRHVEDRG